MHKPSIISLVQRKLYQINTLKVVIQHGKEWIVLYYNCGNTPFRTLLMNRMPLSLSKKIHLSTAGIIFILAQGILLIPSRLHFILQFFPSWGSVAIGAALFAISILSFFTAIRSIAAKDTSGWRANETLL